MGKPPRRPVGLGIWLAELKLTENPECNNVVTVKGFLKLKVKTRLQLKYLTKIIPKIISL